MFYLACFYFLYLTVGTYVIANSTNQSNFSQSYEVISTTSSKIVNSNLIDNIHPKPAPNLTKWDTSITNNRKSTKSENYSDNSNTEEDDFFGEYFFNDAKVIEAKEGITYNSRPHNHGPVNSEQCEKLDSNIIFSNIIIVWLVAAISAFSPYFPCIDKQNKKFISIINCLGAGILLGTCFFHYMPEVRESFTHMVDKDSNEHYDPHSLYFELYMIGGFMMILLMEQFFTTYLNRFFTGLEHCHGHGEVPEETSTQIVSSSHAHGHSHGHNHSHGQGRNHTPRKNSSGLEAEQQELLNQTSSPTSGIQPQSDDHCHELTQSHSSLRAIAFVASLAVHSVVEGASLTFQAINWSKNSALLLSISIHKIAIGLTMGFALQSSKLTKRDSLIALFIWTIFSPLGAIISWSGCGTGVFSNNMVPPLNAIGLGTFLYILFFEIAPHEFLGTGESPNKFIKSLIMLFGVLFTFGLSQVFGHSHDDHQHSH